MARNMYHWFRLYDDFFDDKRIKRLRQLPSGSTIILIYLQMLEKAINTDGILFFDGITKEFYEELALDLGEKTDDVHFTIESLKSVGLLQVSPDGRQYLLTEYRREDRNLVGDGKDSTARVRKLRAKENPFSLPKKEPYSGSERVANSKAKKYCREQGNVPMIEDSVNRNEYGLKYYLAFKRDKCRCRICGSDKNLLLHRIGNEKCNAKNVTGNENGNVGNVNGNEINVTANVTGNEICRMITLCSDCYNDIGNGKKIPVNILESIGFTDVGNVGNEICNDGNVDTKQGGNEKCNAKEIDIDININQSSSSACAREPDKQELNLVKEQWNTLSEYGIKPLQVIWPFGTQAKTITKLLDDFGQDSFASVVAHIKISDYLQGKSSNRKYPINFDWLIDPENYVSVLQGKYDNHMALPDKQNKGKVRNFLPTMQSYDNENWDELENQLLDN